MGVDEKYFGDIVARPTYWDEAPKRVTAIFDAVKSLDNQLVDNIRQLNASKDIDFNVALNSLSNLQKEIKLSDLYDN